MRCHSEFFKAAVSGLWLCAALVGSAAGAQDIGVELTNNSELTAGWIRVADDDSLEPQTFTIEAWITPKGYGWAGAPLLVGKPWEGATANYLLSYGIIWEPTTGVLAAYVAHDLGVSGSTVQSVGTAPMNESTHVTFTFDGSWLRLYLDGYLDSEAAASSATIDYGTQDVLIGAANFGASTTFKRRFQGVIDEVRIWDHARSAETVRYRKDCPLVGDEAGLRAYYSFDASNAVDDSPNGNDGIAEGTVAFVGLDTRCLFADDFEDGDLSSWSGTVASAN
jgi:hypothetical protein